jgi:hypothetical protein
MSFSPYIEEVNMANRIVIRLFSQCYQRLLNKRFFPAFWWFIYYNTLSLPYQVNKQTQLPLPSNKVGAGNKLIVRKR